MEGLESSGPMTSNSSDPLLSATLSSSSPSRPDNYRNHIHDDSYSSHGRNSPHSQTAATTTAFNQYTTLTPLQPLPPISTVTNSSVKFNRSTASPAVSESDSGAPSGSSMFFQQTPTSSIPNSLNFGSFAYNINIKYVYDMKNEPDAEDGQPTDSSNDSRNEYTTPVTLHQQLHQLTEPFSPSQSPYVPSYSGVLEPKQEKLDFISSTSYNTFNGPNDILDTETMETVKRNGSSPLQADTISHAGSPDSGSDMDELNTKDLAQRISAELKRYSIPQAIFAQRVLCRSQGTLSDLLRNPKPWSKLKSGRETFRRMAKWLQEPEFQRMSALRLAACKRKDEQQINGASQPTTPKKPRLVFTDIQRRTLQAIFKETKRPSREMQLTISQQLQLDPTTVANFFMNARRRGHDRGRQEEEQQEQQQQQEQLQQSQTRQQEQQQQHQSEQQHDVVLNSNTNSETILGTIPPPPVFEQL
ncbi:Homeobox protein onecut, putative [Brugia malayi]|uniref:One cut domain family member n=2 Tax=Brugia malayi TaxID=6279 RepID=A0A4E9EWD8_BRUMA|nr:Homeobox protein onecut, putative [Brugia malayi]VIO87730.1 Homeobox protein onecut, putative [Brugia malayi]